MPARNVRPKLESLLRQLSRRPPSAESAKLLTRAIELELLQLLRRGGIREVEQAVRDARAAGVPLEATQSLRGMRSWHAIWPDAKREFAVQIFATPVIQSVSASWQIVSGASLSKKLRDLSARQKQFYDGYLAAGQRYYMTRGAELSEKETLLLLLGELESDVNNVGLARYIKARGKKRAKAALGALQHVGADASAAILQEALKPDQTEKALRKLDEQLRQHPDDLASLTAVALRSRTRRGRG